MAEHALNLRLVAAVERHPCLYNYHLAQYSRKDLNEQAWTEVGKAVNLTGSECKERWKNLRSVFVRHLRPSSAKHQKPYYLSEAMQFTLPFVKSVYLRRAPVTVKLEADSDQEESTATSVANEHDQEESPSPCSSPTAQAHNSPQPSSYTGNKRPLEEDPLLEARDALEGANRMFLLSLLPDVNMMTPSQVRTFKRRVMETIDDILEDSYIKP